MVNEGYWINGNGQKRLNAGGLKLWQEKNKSKLLDPR